MKIECCELTRDAFAPYGSVMVGCDKLDVPVPTAEEDFTSTVIVPKIELDNVCNSGMLICKSREKIVHKMECHKKTAEILVAVKNDVVLCVAPKSDGQPDKSMIKAFTMPQGSVLAMDKACWHWIPFPVGEESAEVLVVFREATVADDLVYADLEEAVEIV